MRKNIKNIFSLIAIFGILLSGLIYADSPDPYQNSGYNNVSYDLPSKFYVGANIGYSMFTANDFMMLNKKGSFNSNSIDFGGFAGYKFNDYAALELNFQRLGQMKYAGNNIPFYYWTGIYNLSGDLILNYPLIKDYGYTASIFGKGGYGFNFANYNYYTHDNSIHKSGDLIKGAYNLGVGINIDFRSNISARFGYTYYQTHYPMPGSSEKAGTNLFAFALAYNFD